MNKEETLLLSSVFGEHSSRILWWRHLLVHHAHLWLHSHHLLLHELLLHVVSLAGLELHLLLLVHCIIELVHGVALIKSWEQPVIELKWIKSTRNSFKLCNFFSIASFSFATFSLEAHS